MKSSMEPLRQPHGRGKETENNSQKDIGIPRNSFLSIYCFLLILCGSLHFWLPPQNMLPYANLSYYSVTVPSTKLSPGLQSYISHLQKSQRTIQLYTVHLKSNSLPSSHQPAPFPGASLYSVASSCIQARHHRVIFNSSLSVILQATQDKLS